QLSVCPFAPSWPVRLPSLAFAGHFICTGPLTPSRTFASADVSEPPEPERVRAVCCRRLSGPATGFMELPDARMHWAPVPHRNDRGIVSWTPQWLCMRCQNMLPTARVQPPGPPPCGHRCLTLMSWEVDLASHTERWVCSRCPFAHMARPLALGPEPSPALVASLEHAANASAQAQLPLSPVLPGLARRIKTTGETEPADAPPPVAAPAAELGGAVQHTEAEPPVLPFAASTNSAVYVPLLLDAAGMLSAGARRAAAASSTTGAPSRDDARTPAGAEPQAAAATPEAGPPAQPPPDERGPRLALSQAEDDSAARPAQAPSAAAPADSEDPATAPSNVPAAAWAQLDGIALQTEFAIRLPTMQGVPAFLRPGIRQAYTFSLRALRD
ncbi:unnamed protein product, partial [Symbiodinium microadriaticum]